MIRRGVTIVAQALVSRRAITVFECLLVGIAVVVASANAFFLYPELRHDDAFITFQYARNLASGNGMVFNPDERVLGTTTPLYTLLLAGVYLVFGDVLPRAAVVIGSFALALQALLLERILRSLGRPTSFGVALLLLAGFSGGLTELALETHVYAALVLGSVLAFDRRRFGCCGVLLGLTVLCRTDAVLLCGLLGGIAWFEQRKFPRRMVIGALGVTLPWIVASTLYFGSPFPQTLEAKRNITPFLAYLSHYATYFARSPASAIFGSADHLALRLLTLPLAAFGVSRMYRSTRSAAWLAAFGALLLLAYACIGPHATQHWHMYVPALIYRVSCVVGCLCLIQCIASRMLSVAWSASMAVAYSTVLAMPFVAHAEVTAQRSVGSFWLGQRHGRYAEVSAWLTAHVKADGSVLAPEVGTLGYLTRRRMIDASGLINETNDFPRVPSLANLAGVVTYYQPDVLVLDSREQGAFFERVTQYRIVKVFEWDPWSTILVRNHDVLEDPRILATGQ